jgi:LacI family gluconate utilization system Gnt-I transcriptional repressor
MAVTLADVAARAGVSTITVSRALRTPEKLAPAARERVEAAIRELGYVPNLVASSLASARSKTVGIVVPTIANSIFADTVEGASGALEAQGYAVLLAQSGYDAAREARVLRALLGRQPEALVMVGSPATREARQMLRRARVRVVETWELPADPLDKAVGFDNRKAGEAAARHLIGRGRQRLAFLGGGDPRALRRFAGFSQAAAEAGVRPPIHIQVGAHGSADAAAAATPHIGDADAIFTATDAYALGALSALRGMGRSVPADVAVIGLGDLEIGRHCVPSLTTIRIDGRRIGETAAQLILADDPRRMVDVGFELVARESTPVVPTDPG